MPETKRVNLSEADAIALEAVRLCKPFLRSHKLTKDAIALMAAAAKLGARADGEGLPMRIMKKDKKGFPGFRKKFYMPQESLSIDALIAAAKEARSGNVKTVELKAGTGTGYNLSRIKEAYGLETDEQAISLSLAFAGLVGKKITAEPDSPLRLVIGGKGAPLKALVTGFEADRKTMAAKAKSHAAAMKHRQGKPKAGSSPCKMG